MNNKLIIKELIKKYNKDARVIELVTRHPFRFLRDVISDVYDERPVRIMYFGAFIQKKSKNKKKFYSDQSKRLMELLMGYR